METQDIRSEIEKIRTLTSLQKKFYEDARQGDGSEFLRQKIIVTKEELLKCTYRISRSLKELKRKV